jgi:predicted HAD superfamily Cof-like phosphohydrolase
VYKRTDPTGNFADIGRFHTKFGLPSVTQDGPGPRQMAADLLQFRLNFLLEEIGELIEACGGKLEISDIVVAGSRSVTATIPEDYQVDSVEAFDALLDLVVVAMGTAHLFGFPWEDGWDVVQSATMQKVRAAKDGSNSKRGSGWDIVKPEGWMPPNKALALLLMTKGFDITREKVK